MEEQMGVALSDDPQSDDLEGIDRKAKLNQRYQQAMAGIDELLKEMKNRQGDLV